MGPLVLGGAAAFVLKVGRGAGRSETGDGRQLASRWVSVLLVISFPSEPGSAKNYL